MASVNRMVLPSLSRKRLDLSRATKWQLGLIAWRFYITKNALDS
ncbi:MAG: SsrA-binding protein [Flavobacteriaceae bacterium]|nr:SsrA-binding protein [Flavobacteriaceae bacterium]MDG2314827.1 SsrA-binding protein [Flavobacteriaceae bacterium]